MLFVVGGAVFPAVVRVIARVVDRRFFPERIALAELGRSIIPEMAGFTSLPAAATHLTQRLQQALEVEHGYLLVADASGDFFRPMALSGPAADPGTLDRLVVTGDALAAWGDDPLPLPVEALPGELGSALAATGGAYAAPVRLRQRLIGVLVLGPSVHGRPLEREALAELGNVVQQASAMLENTRLFAMATRDALTGLAQRPVLMDRLAREVERSRRTFHPFAVAFVDVDHFKAVNDTRGHQAGDAVLRRVARLLEEGSRHTDQVARYGGEEFLLLMPDTDADGARRHAEALRRSVEAEPIDAGPGPEATRVTVSIGICAVTSPGELDEPEALVRAADEALYRAKNGGRNRVECTRGAGRG
jgi:diguanylate cyclase (GGDEF)-like protein